MEMDQSKGLVSEGFQIRDALSFPSFTEQRRLGKDKKHNLFAAYCADIMMQTYHFDAGDSQDHCLHHGARYFD